MLQQQAQSPINELMQAKILRATLSERQLEEVLVDFWFNHFNVFVGKGQVREFLTEYERDAIRPNVLGNFRTMLGATAHSPAMLFYLDNFQSSSANAPQLNPNQMQRLMDPRLNPAQRRQIEERMGEMQPNQPQRPQRGLNENYARELMELHTLGVDAGYTQQDVIEVAKILTGWTIDRPQQGGGYVFRPQMHEGGSKTVLGQKFKEDGEKEGERLLDMLAAHPATAKHISFKLAQRFVADEPPQALVDRAAKKFLDTKGDLREVTRTIITSPEFFDAKYRSAKVKTPLEFVISAARATNAHIVNAQPMVQALRELGMPLYGAQPPTGYSMTADAWVNTGALLNRMNFAVQMLAGGQPQRMGGPGRNGQGPPDQRAATAARRAAGARRTGPASGTAAARPDSDRRPHARAGHQRRDDWKGDRHSARRPGVRRHAPDDRARDHAAAVAGARAGITGVSEEISSKFKVRSSKGITAMMTSRVFLRNGSAALVSLGFTPAFIARAAQAARAKQKILVAIFQRGAVDGLNMVVPFGENAYYANRPSIAIPKPNAPRAARSISTGSSASIRACRRCCPTSRTARSPSSMRADRTTTRGRTSTRRTTWRAARRA